MKVPDKLYCRATIACALALAMSGCAGSSLMRLAAPAPMASDKPIPTVGNCINIDSGSQNGTPATYVCNGKTYTSRELHKLREDGASSAIASSK